MRQTIEKLEHLIEQGIEYVQVCPEEELTAKEAPGKWSKKEILGHLVDSGIHNLQRFNEVQFEPKPYKIRKYNQDALVQSNDYQNANAQLILALWESVNRQIVHVMKGQTELILWYTIELDDGVLSDLRFLMTDYVDHLAHHLSQIVNGKQ